MNSNKRRFNVINSAISDNLKRIRGHHTQEEFADILNRALKRYNIIANYDSKTISNWESLKSKPKLNVLIAIAKEFNLSLDELLKDDLELIDRDIKQIHQVDKEKDKNEDILDELKKDDDVCICEKNKTLSAWNSFDYKYGKLSYVVESMLEYQDSYSRHFSIKNDEMYTSIIVGISVLKNNKIKTYFLDRCNGIVQITNIPSKCSVEICDVVSLKRSFTKNECINNNMDRLVLLNNCESYVLHSNEIIKIDEAIDDFISKGNTKYSKDEINKILDSNFEKTLEYIPSQKFFMAFTGFFECYKCGDADIVAYCFDGYIKISKHQMIKVLVDDYQYRLEQILSNISDNKKYEIEKAEIEKYENL